MRQLFLTLVIAAALLGVGVYHGFATDRWASAAADEQPSRLFADLPLQYGDWKGELLPRDTDEDAKTSAIDCRFTNVKTGKWVLTALSSGRTGRVAVHNPEHCYLGSGYRVVDAIRPESLAAGKPSPTFWTGHFEKKKPTGVESIRIYWGWSNDGNWQAPDYPRFFFSPTRPLHKLYLIHPVTGRDSPDDLAAYKEFMVQYAAELSRRLAN